MYRGQPPHHIHRNQVSCHGISRRAIRHRKRYLGRGNWRRSRHHYHHRCDATSITVTPASATISVIGSTNTQQFDAVGNYSGGSMDVAFATWTATNTSVATFSTSTPGLATAVAAGITTVTATLSGVSGTANLMVTMLLRWSLLHPPRPRSLSATLLPTPIKSSGLICHSIHLPSQLLGRPGRPHRPTSLHMVPRVLWLRALLREPPDHRRRRHRHGGYWQHPLRLRPDIADLNIGVYTVNTTRIIVEV
jgi:Bacterial Ig-like domain (group 2)